jgi:hypothetical protein
MIDTITNKFRKEPSATSQSFIKIIADKLSLQTTLPIPDDVSVRVVSILGKARMGKSTFLNAIVSKLKGVNLKPFATQDNDEHCTRGIDAFYCAEQHLLLLDCQGLALEDSSHDPALLLFAYLVSDLIIFNERMMLQNEALKLMEPICTFMTYLSMEEIEKQKPRLYFRISDGDIVKDAGKNLEKVVFARYNDQYQSIRDSITTLFHNVVGIVKTDSLDRGIKGRLRDNDFLALFEDPSLGFEGAISEILETLPEGQPGHCWKAKVPHIIKSINNNEKITIDKLDVVGAVGKLELLEWIGTLPSTLYSELPADGLQATYDSHIKPRQNAKKQILSDFTRKFKAISETIKKPYYDDLAERLDAPIQSALKQMVERATLLLKDETKVAKKDREVTIDNVHRGFSNLGDEFWDKILEGHADLDKACKPVYAQVRELQETWLTDCRSKLRVAMEDVLRFESEERQAMWDLSSTELESFRVSTLKKIVELTPSSTLNVLLLHPLKYAKQQIADQIPVVTKALQQVPQYHEIVVKIHNRVFSANTRHAPFGEEHRPAVTHDSVLPVYNGFVKHIQDSSFETKLANAVTKRKEELLFGTSLDLNSPRNIPDVEFMAIITYNKPKFVTNQTFEHCIRPLVRRVIEQMTKDGYLLPGDDALLCPPAQLLWGPSKKGVYGNNVLSFYQIAVHPESSLNNIFCDIYDRLNARERVKGKGSLYVSPPETVGSA